MRIYLKKNVYEAAIERTNWLFDEFPNVIVNFSGGKDSTVVLNLALQVAEERGRLPLQVFFLDQEAEFSTVIEYMRRVAADPRVDMKWLQVPIKILNASSYRQTWLHCWAPEDEDVWVRPREPNSIHENIYGTDRFGEMFSAYNRHHFPDQKLVRIAGVRTEESPARHLGLTAYETYGGETWGAKEDVKRGHYVFYPIYDWTYSDVWKAIHDNGWDYCRLYDLLYQYGVPPKKMRVSNVHHETAMKSLYYLQEIEGENWDRITRRLDGINTVGQMQDQFFKPRELPWMFSSWVEYRDHLLENLVVDPAQREKFRKAFAQYDPRYRGKAHDDLIKTEIAMILVNDVELTKMEVFVASHMKDSVNRGVRSGRT